MAGPLTEKELSAIRAHIDGPRALPPDQLPVVSMRRETAQALFATIDALRDEVATMRGIRAKLDAEVTAHEATKRSLAASRALVEQRRKVLSNTLTGLVALANAAGGTPPPDYHRRVNEAKASLLLTEEMMEGIQRGVAAVKEGRIRPWKDVERELWPTKAEMEEK